MSTSQRFVAVADAMLLRILYERLYKCKFAGIKLADGVTPASRKLGRFMESALSSRLPKRVMLQMYVAVTAMDANVPTAEEFLKDLKDAGFTYPTWF